MNNNSVEKLSSLNVPYFKKLFAVCQQISIAKDNGCLNTFFSIVNALKP